MEINRDKIILAIMLIPALVLVTLFAFYPLVYNINMSFQDVTSNTLISGNLEYIALDNYIEIFKSNEFHLILKNTLIFLIGSISLQFLIGLFLALYFDNDFPFKNSIRGLFLIGWIIPPAVIGTIWRWLLNYDIGVINYFLSLIGLNSQPWLVSSGFSLFSVVIANVWFNVPFNMILITSSLSSIPDTIYDAAAIDGTNLWQKIFYIKIPMIKSSLYILLLLNSIYAFRSFSLIWNMTKGGPVNSSTILPVWAYVQSFNHYEFGFATAISVLIFIFLVIVSIIYIRFFINLGEE